MSSTPTRSRRTSPPAQTSPTSPRADAVPGRAVSSAPRPADGGPTRRERRARRARRRRVGALTAAGLGLVLVATTGMAAALPLSAPDAAASVVTAPGAVLPAAAASSIGAFGDVRQDADTVLATAQITLGTAAEVTAEVAEEAASGLSLDAAGTGTGAEAGIDTAALRDSADRLDSADLLPVLLLPTLVDEVAGKTAAVQARVAEVRTDLQAARDRRAAEEAAAAAQKAAEEAAAQAQRDADAAAAALAAVNTPDGAKAVAAQMAADTYGWGADQFSCLSSLWQKESGWDYQAYNDSSGATGIPQSLPGSKMASAGSDWETNAATQIAWGLDYISRAYGTPCSAWGHSQSTNWY